MRPLAIVASTLVNACGTGWGEFAAALRHGRSGLVANDFPPAREVATFIGRVRGLEDAPLSPRFARFDCRVNRLVQLALEQDGFTAAVAAARARLGARRIGVFVGTSTSGILDTELATRSALRAGAAPHLDAAFRTCRHSMMAPVRFIREALDLRGIAMTISTACSSSAKVFASAARAIDSGLCDAALVGGADSLALSTLHGFRSLELLSTEPCRPCDAARNGISIGEAAGFALLVPGVESAVRFTGSGESADAWHMSTPHPEGAGALRAMRAAIASAGIDARAVDYVNLHGTATIANDLSEDRAVCAALPHRPDVSSTKGWTGHALGAAGVTEALITAYALEQQWVPATLGCRTVDPRLGMRVAIGSRNARLVHALSNSFGFGGSNCSLLLSRTP
ncbi:MAG TPA: beta-ketoacyl-ACP synthase [Casimicrobiaceae bacterium]|nr:beta-ketoacyl-ACP synthase [Casimicrobiaceae bacterium]